MPKKWHKYRNLIRKYFYVFLIGFLISLLSIIPLRSMITSWKAPNPQAILVLGGPPNREEAAAQLSAYEPHLEIWISKGIYSSKPKEVLSIFQKAGVDIRKVHLDYQATDTVTNFTSLVSEFKTQNIKHLYIITSDSHMPRAKTIATIILGSNGIIFTPVYVPTSNEEESFGKVLRDGARSILWVFTGFSGA